MEELKISLSAEAEKNSSETVQCLIDAASQIFSSSEKDFEEMKNTKWYKRLWQLITFSKDNEKKLANGVSSLSKLQEIVMKALLIMSEKSAEISDFVCEHDEKIARISKAQSALAKTQDAILDEIDRLKSGAEKSIKLQDVDGEKRGIFMSVFSSVVDNLNCCNTICQEYYRSVYEALERTDAQDSIKIDSVNMLNRRETLLLYRIIMEYLFLANNSFESNVEVLQHLAVSKKDAESIQTLINKQVMRGGKEILLVNRDIEYSFVDEYEIEWEYFEEDENAEEFSYEEQSLTGIISIQKVTEYKYKKLLISAAFAVNDFLTFNNCIITIEENAYFNVTGKLVFENCEIICKKANTVDNYVITSVDGGNVIFRNCVIKNAQYFLNATGDIELKKCSIIDCNNFIYAHSSHTMYSMKIIDTCIIDTISQVRDNTTTTDVIFEHLMTGRSTKAIFSVQNYNMFEVRNFKTVLPNLKSNKLMLFDAHSYEGLIENSEIDNSIIYTPGIIMNQCTVQMSELDVSALKNSVISQSNIKCPYNSIDRCDFNDMRENVVKAKGFTNCTFNNIVCRTENFIKTTASISNCIFSNVDIGNGKYLIEAIVDYGLGDKKEDIYVKDSRFINCCTDRADKKIITGNSTHHKIFADKTVSYNVQCKNCMGINQIKGGSFAEIKVEKQVSSTLNGAKIGASIGAVIPGIGVVAGGIIGAAIGAVADSSK